MSDPTFMQDDAAVASRQPEVPLAAFDDGVNLGGSCAPGIGINIDEGAVVGTPEQFTLLDQRGAARTPQTSQHIGGLPYADPSDYPLSGGTEGILPEASVRFGTPSDEGDGTISGDKENATLTTLATGWEAPPP